MNDAFRFSRPHSSSTTRQSRPPGVKEAKRSSASHTDVIRERRLLKLGPEAAPKLGGLVGDPAQNTAPRRRRVGEPLSSISTVVVSPTPFGPNRPKISPRATLNVRRRRRAMPR